MDGHKNTPSANPLFPAVLWAHPILHISRIRVKYTQLVRTSQGTVSLVKTNYLILLSKTVAIYPILITVYKEISLSRVKWSDF